jgi:hypothetical protein
MANASDVGHAATGLQVVGGVLIHQVRLSLATQCNAKFAKLQHRCNSAIGNPNDSIYGHAYGVDPFFNSQSALFSSHVHAGDFYNISIRSGEINAVGQPFAFFARDVSGYPHGGFPVIFPVCHCFTSGSCKVVIVLCFGLGLHMRI